MKNTKKMVIKRETLRALSAAQLGFVAGGSSAVTCSCAPCQIGGEGGRTH